MLTADAIKSAGKWIFVFLLTVIVFLFYLDYANKQLSWSPFGLFDKEYEIKNNSVAKENNAPKAVVDTSTPNNEGGDLAVSKESVETPSQPNPDESAKLITTNNGDDSISIYVPANKIVSIQSTQDAQLPHRFNLFRKSEGTNEWVHVESKYGSDYFEVPTMQKDFKYIVTAEHKDGSWERSTISSIENSDGQTEVLFEDTGHNIEAGREYDLRLVLTMN